ncbi:MAG: cobalamin-binding protein [Desulfovibrionaceae bacterium]|nr:cobalamin-binding protein [Desulfovibrionaceae bacterium]
MRPKIIVAPLLCLALLCLAAAGGRGLVDQTGRRVLVPARPCRVVCLAPSVTEIAFALGGAKLLVGATSFSDHPPEALALPRVGSYARPDVERILALRPDLCLAVRDGNPLEVVDRLEELGVPVFAVDPRSLAGVVEAVRAVALALGLPDQGEVLARSMEARLARVRGIASRAGSRPRVLYQIGASPMVTAGTGTFMHEMIGLAGGENAAAGLAGYPVLSWEEAVRLSPEVVIVPSMPREGGLDETLRRWREWPGVPAVAAGRIYAADSDLLDRPGPRLVDGLELLARLIHPELFEAGP